MEFEFQLVQNRSGSILVAKDAESNNSVIEYKSEVDKGVFISLLPYYSSNSTLIVLFDIIKTN